MRIVEYDFFSRCEFLQHDFSVITLSFKRILLQEIIQKLTSKLNIIVLVTFIKFDDKRQIKHIINPARSIMRKSIA